MREKIPHTGSIYESIVSRDLYVDFHDTQKHSKKKNKKNEIFDWLIASDPINSRTLIYFVVVMVAAAAVPIVLLDWFQSKIFKNSISDS